MQIKETKALRKALYAAIDPHQQTGQPQHGGRKKEMWLVHSLCMGNGRSLIGVADSRSNANTLYKEMCHKIWGNDEINFDNFVKTIRKVKGMNEVVINLI